MPVRLMSAFISFRHAHLTPLPSSTDDAMELLMGFDFLKAGATDDGDGLSQRPRRHPRITLRARAAFMPPGAWRSLFSHAEARQLLWRERG